MEFVEHLKSSVDIVGVVGQYVRLRKIGQRYLGLCPFHTEKTPSFNVNPAHQFYKCFGCGEGGDVIKFVEKIEGLSFYEALTLLAERHGIPIPKRTSYSDEETRLHASIYRMHEIAFDTFRAALNSPGGAEARAYITKRGVAPAVSQEFGLGFAERSGNLLARRFERENFTAAEMEAGGLVLKRQDGSGFFDRFRGRLMFPIHNESGKIIGFGGRALAKDDEPKYMNSPETPIYHKSYVLYNLHRAKDAIRKNERTVLVEGYMDAIGVYAAGIKEVVAPCGTAFTSQQVRSLKRHADRIVVNFDPDAAGEKAAEKYIPMLLDEGMHVRILQLDGGLDPDEYANQRGADAYRAKLESAHGYFVWLADRARAKQDTRTAEGRMAVLQSLLPAIQRISDAIERAAVANEVASYLGVDRGLVLDYFRKAVADRRETKIAPPREPVAANERLLLNLLLQSEEIRVQIVPRLKGMPAVERFGMRRIFQALFALHESGARTGFAELDARLEESDRSLLAEVVLVDEMGEEHVRLDQAQACLRQLETADLSRRKAELRARLKEAELAGNPDEAMRVMEEIDRLGKA
jgi:DNA primase